MLEIEMEELLPIATELIRKYSGYESTSVTYEKAQQIMGAVLYCVREVQEGDTEGGNGEGKGLTTTGLTAREAYEAGYAKVLRKVEALRTLYNSMIEDFDAYGSRVLYDTVVKGIPEFLKWYDPRYNPQDTILTLDYPILKDLSFCSGVDRVLLYLQQIAREQKFLKRFESSRIRAVLRENNPFYEDAIENIYEIVVENI